ncbi:MAG TPA: TonB-dependent receptor [Steroidobacteraceae bacterium]|jgi:iron complex outermembrane receptor protein|nr:TonB-dependent receptor [Steroidobacteraceae bacterium]
MSKRVKGLRGAAGRLALCSLIAAVPAVWQSATAQTTTDQSTTDQTAAAPAPSGDQLQEVVVTAERRAEDIMSTPISVVAISGDTLNSTKVVDINSLGSVAPNLQIYTTGATSTADIRGVGNSNQGGIEQPGVVIVRDGLPNISEGNGANVPYFDTTDVEVLRGPQGTFAGDNSTGGAIIVNSASPNFRGINGYADVQAGTYSDQRAQTAINLPVSDTFAMRLAINEETRGSFYRNGYSQINGPYEYGPALCPGAPPCLGTTVIGPAYPVSGDHATYDPGNVDDKDMRLGLLWKPSDSWQSLTKIEFDREDSEGIQGNLNENTFIPFGGVTKACPSGDTKVANGQCLGQFQQYYTGQPFSDNSDPIGGLYQDDVNQFSEQLQFTAANGIQYRLTGGDQEITGNTAGSTNIGIPGEAYIPSTPITEGTEPFNQNQTLAYIHIHSGEFDILSPTTGKLSWIAGTSMVYDGFEYASYAVNAYAPNDPTHPSTSGYFNGEYITARNEGIFGQVSFQFTPKWQIVAGVRNGWDSEVALGGLSFGASIPSTCTPAPFFTAATNPCQIPAQNGVNGLTGNANQPTNGAPSDRVVTGKVDVNYTPTPGQYIYAFVARGYKPGEENLGVNPGTHYEYVNDYETGWKGKFDSGHVNLQVDGYYMQYMDMIHSIFDPQIPTSTNEENIPFSILKGIEVTAQANVAHFSINANLAFNKSILGPLLDAETFKFPHGTQYGVTPQCGPGQTPSTTLTANQGGCSDYEGKFPGDVNTYVDLSGEALPYAPEYTANGSIQYTIPLDNGNMALVPRVSYAYQDYSYSDIFQGDNYYLIPSHSLWNAYLDWNAGTWTTTVYATNLANTAYLEGIGYYGNPRQLGLEVRYTY